jgi:hypothetical protein
MFHSPCLKKAKFELLNVEYKEKQPSSPTTLRTSPNAGSSRTSPTAESILWQQKAMMVEVVVKIGPYNVSSQVDAIRGGTSATGIGVINNGNRALAQQEAKEVRVAVLVHPDDVTLRVHPERERLDGSGYIDGDKVAVTKYSYS